jgi:hypothetical protein
MVNIETLKKGDYFKISEKHSTVYVYDGYNRSTRKYSSYKYSDISDFREFKKGKQVFIGFEF